MLDNDGSQDNTFSSFSSFTQKQTTENSSNAEPSFLAPRNLLHEQAGQLSLSFSASIAQLTQLWMNERNAPELLFYERYLVEPLIEAIEVQAEFIMEQVEDKFASMLFQTEIERIKYLLKSYLRTRLFKIEKYPLYILRQSNLKDLLSSQEIVYVRRYQELIESHYSESFLYQLPLSQHKQDEVSGDLSMVVEPNLDAPVFCKALVTVGHIDVHSDNEVETILLEKGDNILLRYRDVRDLLKEGKVRLV
ncbi:hypothetical protein MFLAVUS_006613 [Mucor flavus]|uniref:DNA replication complex GINS protein SLD5 n=1 Tax=Mucor flavus TaxID=439312 RepID=A0ABP9Z211_9FUNG